MKSPGCFSVIISFSHYLTFSYSFSQITSLRTTQLTISKREIQEALIGQAICLKCHPRDNISVSGYHRLLTNLKKQKKFLKTRLNGAWKSFPSNGCKTLTSGTSTKGSQILLISKVSYYGILKKLKVLISNPFSPCLLELLVATHTPRSCSLQSIRQPRLQIQISHPVLQDD